MKGIFVTFEVSGFGVVRVDEEGEFGMDWKPHRSKAVAYANKLAHERGLPLFVQQEVKA